MKFFMFHLMPYKDLPGDYDQNYDSAWVTLPNSFYDPERGAELYNEYLDELEYADELGFDGVCVNEHHNNAYGNMPSPNLMAALLARRTKNVDIAIIGNALPLRNHPLRVAEEISILDVVTRGRIISGFVRGIGAEYHVFGVNPNESRDRFMEAHDLLMQAWTKPGPFTYEGKYYNENYVNPWPCAYQKPHPPIWIPSQGSAETIEWASERKYTYLQTFSKYTNVKKYLQSFHEVAREKWGYNASPYQLGWAMPLYVAETDEQAMEEASEALEFFYNKLLRMPNELFFPPGYLTERSEKAVLSAKKDLGGGKHTVEKLVNDGYALIGGVDTIVERLCQYQSEINLGIFVTMLQFGTLSHELTKKNMKTFAEKVIPRVREKVGNFNLQKK
jgi:alkanesulfonate monooxygenase SsuD/methylene tetrahydromethanopterin reductase-like flavin-dependent oxidoreductase (luciferase family)